MGPRLSCSHPLQGLPPELPTPSTEVKVLLPCLGSVDQISKPRLWSFGAAEIATAWVRAAVTTAPTRRHPTPNAHTHMSMRPDGQNSSQNLLEELPHLQTNRIQKLQPWVFRTSPEGEVGLLRHWCPRVGSRLGVELGLCLLAGQRTGSGQGAHHCLLEGGKQVSCCLMGSPQIKRIPVALFLMQPPLPNNSDCHSGARQSHNSYCLPPI